MLYTLAHIRCLSSCANNKMLDCSKCNEITHFISTYTHLSENINENRYGTNANSIAIHNVCILRIPSIFYEVAKMSSKGYTILLTSQCIYVDVFFFLVFKFWSQPWSEWKLWLTFVSVCNERFSISMWIHLCVESVRWEPKCNQTKIIECSKSHQFHFELLWMKAWSHFQHFYVWTEHSPRTTKSTS